MANHMKKSRAVSHLAAAKARMYRDLVFESAERVFAEAGFEGATMQAIAAEAGISLKTLYATFPGKDDVYREIRKQRAREFLEHATKSVQDAGSVTQRL